MCITFRPLLGFVDRLFSLYVVIFLFYHTFNHSSIMPKSTIANDLEVIMANPHPSPLREGPRSSFADGEALRQAENGNAVAQPGMRPPPIQPNMLNEAMAKEAAKKFKKKEKRIQKACAALDAGEPLPPKQAACCCVIL